MGRWKYVRCGVSHVVQTLLDGGTKGKAFTSQGVGVPWAGQAEAAVLILGRGPRLPPRDLCPLLPVLGTVGPFPGPCT